MRHEAALEQDVDADADEGKTISFPGCARLWRCGARSFFCMHSGLGGVFIVYRFSWTFDFFAAFVLNYFSILAEIIMITDTFSFIFFILFFFFRPNLLV